MQAVGNYLVIKFQNRLDGGSLCRGSVVSVGDTVDLPVGPFDVVIFTDYDSKDMGDCLVVVHAANIRGREHEVACERDVIYGEIEVERRYQDRKWGGSSHDDTETEENWQKYIKEYSQGEGRGAGRDFRTRMLKTAALAVAAIEAYDRDEG